MNSSTVSGIALGFLLSLTLAASSFARTWTEASSGTKIEAEFVKLEEGSVILKMGGRLTQVPLDRLSAEDQVFVKKQVSGESEQVLSTDWPRWRGADFSGVSPDKGLLKEWPEGGPKKVWAYDSAGMGYAGYSITGGKLFTLGTRGDDLVVICLNAETGAEVWSTKFAQDDKAGYNVGWGNGPRSTPTIANGKVYVLGPQGTLACLTADEGKKEWDKNLVNDFGGKGGGWGFSESPLVDGDKVVVAAGGTDSAIVALNKDTGATIWKTEGISPGKGQAEYASIIPVDLNDSRQYLKLFNDQLVSVAADSGKLLWKTDWGGGSSPAVIPTPIIEGNQVYITSGYGVGSKLVEVSDGNEVADVWSNSDMKNKHGGVVKIGDHVYGFSEGGGLICQDWKTGGIVWNEKGQFFGSTDSLTAADGMLYCVNESSGAVTLVEANPKEFKQKGQFTLEPQSKNRNPKGKIWTHPVVVGGKLFLRDQEHIVCYDVKGGS